MMLQLCEPGLCVDIKIITVMANDVYDIRNLRLHEIIRSHVVSLRQSTMWLEPDDW